MEIKHYICDWCSTPLSTNDNENYYSGNLELCCNCGDLKVFTEAMSLRIAKRLAKDTNKVHIRIVIDK